MAKTPSVPAEEAKLPEQMRPDEFAETHVARRRVGKSSALRGDAVANEHQRLIAAAVAKGKPVLVATADEYNTQFPPGWTVKGDLYVPPAEPRDYVVRWRTPVGNITAGGFEYDGAENLTRSAASRLAKQHNGVVTQDSDPGEVVEDWRTPPKPTPSAGVGEARVTKDGTPISEDVDPQAFRDGYDLALDLGRHDPDFGKGKAPLVGDSYRQGTAAGMAKRRASKPKKTKDDFDKMISDLRERKAKAAAAVLARWPEGPAHLSSGTIGSNQVGKQFRGIAIFPSVSKPGEWQLSRYDEKGFSGHENYASREKAIDEAVSSESMSVAAENPLHTLQTTEKFIEGAFAVHVAQRYNDLRAKGKHDEAKKMDEIAEKDGREAALDYYRSVVKPKKRARLPERKGGKQVAKDMSDRQVKVNRAEEAFLREHSLEQLAEVNSVVPADEASEMVYLDFLEWLRTEKPILGDGQDNIDAIFKGWLETVETEKAEELAEEAREELETLTKDGEIELIREEILDEIKVQYKASTANDFESYHSIEKVLDGQSTVYTIKQKKDTSVADENALQDREDLAGKVARASRRPDLPVVKSASGRWAYNSHGVTMGKDWATEKEARDAQTKQRDDQVNEFLDQLMKMSKADLQKQADF